MQFIEREFIPVLLSPNLNAYSLAREFYTAYKIKSIVLGKYPVVQTIYSKLIDFRKVEKLEEDTEFLKEMSKLVVEICQGKKQKIILIGCTDTHIKMIMRNRDELKNISSDILFNYISIEEAEKLMNKEEFYKLCEKYDLPFPETFSFKYENSLDLENFKLPFSYPIVLKPANWTEYARNKFTGQEKVYVNIKTEKEMKNILKKVYESGYTDAFILQTMIPGDDTYMYTMNAYVNSKGEVEMMSLGHVLLEEYTPLGAGNFAVIKNEKNEELEKQVREFLQKINFRGFANFDIKLDIRDGKYKFFEINLRQGNSHFFVTLGGNNVAEFFVRDLIGSEYNFSERGGGEAAAPTKQKLFLIVPKILALIYVSGFKNKLEILKFIFTFNTGNPLFFWPDFSFKRYFYISRYNLGQYLKYWKYFKKKEF
jgi:D-aspartate ligase